MKRWLKGLIFGFCFGAIVFIVINAFFLLSNNPSYQSMVNGIWYKNIPSFLKFCSVGMILGFIIGLVTKKKA